MKTTLEQAEYQYKKKNLKAAIQLYQESLRNNLNNALAYQGLARCYLRSRRYDEAFDRSRKALELDPTLSIPHRVIANIYLHRKQLNLYERELEIVLKKEPNSSDTYIALGSFFLNTKRVKEAVSTLQKAVELDPNNWTTHYHLSVAYLRNSQRKKVFQELTKAYNLSKSYLTGFAFVSAFLSLNRIWLFPLLLVMFVLSFALSVPTSFPFFFIIAGLQIASGIAYIMLRNVKYSALSIMLFVVYFLAWIYFKL